MEGHAQEEPESQDRVSEGATAEDSIIPVVEVVPTVRA
jgi:hypothetical protein